MFEYLIEEVPTTVYYTVMAFAGAMTLALWTYRHVRHVRPQWETEIAMLEQEIASLEYQAKQQPSDDVKKAQSTNAYHAAHQLAIAHVEHTDDTVAKRQYDDAARTPAHSMADVNRRKAMLAVYEASVSEQQSPEYQATLDTLKALTEEALQRNRRIGVSKYDDELQL